MKNSGSGWHCGFGFVRVGQNAGRIAGLRVGFEPEPITRYGKNVSIDKFCRDRNKLMRNDNFPTDVLCKLN